MINAFDEVIADTAEKAAGLCSPFQIFLVSEKRSSSGKLCGFKLCLVVPDELDVNKTESKLLIGIDTPVPCDYIVYRISEWNECVDDDSTFAYRVENSGRLLYE